MQKVLIYRDEGVTERLWHHLHWSLEAELGSAGLRIETIDSAGLRTGSWERDCAVLVFPGGRDLPYHEKLSGEGNRRIRRYVEAGGAYLGLCAGGYYGSAAIEFDKDQALEVCGRRELGFFPGLAVGPAFGVNTFRYGTDMGARAVRLRVLGAGAPGTLCTVYYNGGCIFTGASKLPSVDVLARYQDLPGQPAAIVECAVGRGKALLAGVHPEYRAHLARRDACAPPGLYDEIAASDLESRGLLRYVLARLGLGSPTELDAKRIRALLKDRPHPVLDYRIEYRTMIDSASNVTGNVGEENLREGVVLIAGEQYAGIGQNREKWHSLSKEPGGSTRAGNVTMSVVLEEAVSARELALGRVAAALAVIEALKAVTGDPRLPVRFRGPNDVYSYDPDPGRGVTFRKLAGILAASDHCPEAVAALAAIPAAKPARFQVMGLGINLVHDLLTTPLEREGAKNLADIATSLETLTGVRYPPELVIVEFLRHFEQNLFAVRGGRPGTDFFARVEESLARDAAGRIVLELEEEAGKAPRRYVTPVFSVSADGLEVELDERRKTLSFEEIARFYPFGTSAL